LVLVLILGIGFIVNPSLFSFVASLFVILAGLIFIGSYMDNPLVLAAIIGAFLIIGGIMEIFDLFGSNNEINKIK